MIFLAPADVARLTGKVRFSAQRRALDALGIRYTVAATGEPLVQPAALDAKPGKTVGHRWDMIGGIRNLRP